MRKSAQRSTKIETLEKMLLMSASPLDGSLEADWTDALGSDNFANDELNDLFDVQQEQLTDPFAEDFADVVPEAAPEPLSSNDSFLARVVTLTNQVRSDHGLAHLTNNSALQTTAQLQSVNMAEQDFFNHQGLDGLMAWDRAANEGYNYQTIGENIAAGQLTPEEVVQGWVNSPGHRDNILNPNFTEIGVGYQYLQNDTGVINYHHYWTQVFGTQIPSEADEPAVDTSESDQPAEDTAQHVDVKSTTSDSQQLPVQVEAPAGETDAIANEPEAVKPPAPTVQEEPIPVEHEEQPSEVQVPAESTATEQPTTPAADIEANTAETVPPEPRIESPVTDQAPQDNRVEPPPPANVETNHSDGEAATIEVQSPESEAESVLEPVPEFIVPPAYAGPPAPTAEPLADEGTSKKSDDPAASLAPIADVAPLDQRETDAVEPATENKADAATTKPTTSEERKTVPKQSPTDDAINALPKRTEDALPDSVRHILKESSPATKPSEELTIRHVRPAAVQSPLADIAEVRFFNHKPLDVSGISRAADSRLRGSRAGSPTGPTDHSLSSDTTDAPWKSERGFGWNLNDHWTDRENDDDDDNVAELTDDVDLLTDLTL